MRWSLIQRNLNVLAAVPQNEDADLRGQKDFNWYVSFMHMRLVSRADTFCDVSDYVLHNKPIAVAPVLYNLKNIIHES